MRPGCTGTVKPIRSLLIDKRPGVHGYKVVWAKKTANNKIRLREKIKALLDEIEKVNDQENEEYGDEDLEELGGKGGIEAEKLKAKVAELNERLRQQPQDKPLKKAVKTLEKDYLPRLEKYAKQEKTLQGRSSYSKTDPDASCMSMKEDRGEQKSWPHPAYNVQIGTEGQFVVGYSVHQRAGDQSCFIPHMEQQHWPNGQKPKRGSSDAAYGTEENYSDVSRRQDCRSRRLRTPVSEARASLQQIDHACRSSFLRDLRNSNDTNTLSDTRGTPL